MSRRQQLPPQIKKIAVTDRSTGKSVVRYELAVDAGVNPESGKRRQIRLGRAMNLAQESSWVTCNGPLAAMPTPSSCFRGAQLKACAHPFGVTRQAGNVPSALSIVVVNVVDVTLNGLPSSSSVMTPVRSPDRQRT